MKYPKDFGYMSLIQTISDVNNAFLSRRELTCNFAGVGGKLKTMEATDMVTKEFKLDGKANRQLINVQKKIAISQPFRQIRTHLATNLANSYSAYTLGFSLYYKVQFIL